MRKKLLMLAAVALTASAPFAQQSASAQSTSEPLTYVSFDPLSGSVLNSFSQDVNIHFEDAIPSEATKALITIDNGYGFAWSYDETITIDIPTNIDRVYTLTPTSEMWGNPFDGIYYMKVSVVLMDSQENLLSDEDGYLGGEAGYKCYEKKPDVFLGFYPNDSTWTVDKVPFDLFYTKTNGYCSMTFTEKVIIDGALGTVQYFDPDGYELDGTLTITDFQQYLDETDGLYNVTFRVRNRSYTPAQIGKMVVTITGVQGVDFGGKNPFTINNPSYFPSKQNAPKKTKDIASGLAVSNAPVSVYNTQGMLVKENATQDDINSLAPGLYIVNGKKIIVK